MDDNRKFNQDWENENQGERTKKSSKFALKWNKDKNRNSNNNSKVEIKSGKKRRKAKAAIAVVLVVAVAAGTVFTFRSKGKKAEASGSRVMESKVQKGNLSQTVEGTGTLSNADSTDLKIPVGLKIKKVKVSEGDEVKKGDTLATVDKTSLLAALAETQEELDDVNKQLGDEADSDTSKYVESPVDGRVKKIYASKNTEAADTVLEKGALMLISLDGKMAVKMDTSVSLTVGQKVKVVLSSGSSVTGTVTKAEDESCTITVTDKGTKYNDKVTAYTSSGTKIGTGKLYINKEAKVTATTGTVSSVLVSENEYVSEGDDLVKLKGDFRSEEYLSLESEKEDLEEKLASLLKIAKNNTITADLSGIITAVNVSEDTESGSASESSSSGSSTSSSGTGSSNTATATGMSAVKTTSTATATATAMSAVKTTSMATATGMAESKTTSIPTATGASASKGSNMIKAVRLSTNSDIATQNASEITTKEKNEAGTTESSSKEETNKSTGSSGSQASGSQTDGSKTNDTQNENSESSGTGNSTTDSTPTGNTGNSGTDSSQTGSSTGNSSQSSNSNTSNSSSNKNTTSDSGSGSGNTTTKNATENTTSDENNNESGNSSGTNNQNSTTSDNASGASGAMNRNKNSAGNSAGGKSGFSGSAAAGSAGAMSGSASGSSALSGTASGSTSTTTSSSSTDTNTELTSAFGIASGDEMTLSVSIDEMDILSVKTGQKATITFDAIENKEYEGEITSIDKNGTTSNGTTKYPVEITVTKEDSMMSGMNASVTITTSEVSDALLVPAMAVTEEGNASCVYTQKDSKSGELSGKTEVQTGDTDGTNVVITSGLSEGDTIYYSVSAGGSSDKDSNSADNQDKQNMKMNGNFGGGRGGNDGGTPPSGGNPGGNK